MHEVLSRYGFSENFIDLIKLLYKDIKASIIVNGYKSVMIKIARSVKQGDALSCALFILCIDPLIRYIEANEKIKPIPIARSRFSNIAINVKTGSFADDVGLAVKKDAETMIEIYNAYSLFSSLSGRELNVNKTEIMQLNINSTGVVFVPEEFQFGGETVISTESIKICGITFSSNAKLEYARNVEDKIIKLEQQIIRWLPRYLTLEGKLLIVKTFGLSQIIYSLQMCEIKDSDVKKLESIIYKFLWNKKWSGNRAPDRIKRAYLKLPYERGGLAAPDIAILNAALKSRQFVRASNSSHQIKYIQMYQLEEIGYFEYFKLEYANLCKKDNVIATYQNTINDITDCIRQTANLDLNLDQDAERLDNRVKTIASTDVLEYLHRKKLPLVIYRFSLLSNLGIESFKELCNELQYPRSDRTRDSARDVLKYFPVDWAELVMSSSEVDGDLEVEGVFYNRKWDLVNNRSISVKDIRMMLTDKSELQPRPFENSTKFDLNFMVPHNKNPFLLARKSLYASRDRIFKYRILHGDIFCRKRMFKFKMVDSPNCTYCLDQVETIKHLTWDCPRSRDAWNHVNDWFRTTLGEDYINYETIILGGLKPLDALETIIVWVLRSIMVIDRENLIPSELIKARIESLFNYEKKIFGKTSKKLALRWGKLTEIFSIN
jgi:hypothetical protein